jgi:hypothetical protein
LRSNCKASNASNTREQPQPVCALQPSHGVIWEL